MRVQRFALGLYMAATSVIPACAHSAKPVKSVAAAVVEEDALTKKIREEGRACLRRIKECEQDYFDQNPYASKPEATAACEEVKTGCLEDAHTKLMTEQN